MNKHPENTTKRIFIGAFIRNTEFIENVNKLKREFSPYVKAKWTKPENFHITAHFYGNATFPEIMQIKVALSEILNNPIRHKIILHGLGVFYKKQKPYILYVKPENNEDILSRSISYIQKQLYDNKLIQTLPESYTPHITLARIKHTEENFDVLLNRYKEFNFGEISTIKYEIIESILTPSGPIYKPLQL